MRWIRYEANRNPVYGIVEGDMVTEVHGDPFAGYAKTATRRPLSSVKLLVPVEPRTFYCAGLNYADHVIEAARKARPRTQSADGSGYRLSRQQCADRA
jgi:2-keto-4-pentenoate hydratase/2-oxohepta-3-ene-1,7-dioic acid hydratase in catechol pathway